MLNRPMGIIQRLLKHATIILQMQKLWMEYEAASSIHTYRHSAGSRMSLELRGRQGNTWDDKGRKGKNDGKTNEGSKAKKKKKEIK